MTRRTESRKGVVSRRYEWNYEAMVAVSRMARHRRRKHGDHPRHQDRRAESTAWWRSAAEVWRNTLKDAPWHAAKLGNFEARVLSNTWSYCLTLWTAGG